MGSVVAAAGLFIFASDPLEGGLFTGSLGIANIVIGSVTARSSGVVSQPNRADGVKLLVDRGVFGTSVYQMGFFDKKLVMKRLASPSITIILALVVALVGFLIEGPLGALAGGLTAYSVQEFLTQRKRNKIEKASSLSTPSGRDIDFSYDDIDKVQVKGNRLLIFTGDRLARISLPRGYGKKIVPSLETLMPGLYEYEPEESLASPSQASEKENH